MPNPGPAKLDGNIETPPAIDLAFPDDFDLKTLAPDGSFHGPLALPDQLCELRQELRSLAVRAVWIEQIADDSGQSELIRA